MSPLHKKVIAEAKDKAAGMTVGEVAAFCQEVMRSDLDADQPVWVRTGWRNQVQELRVPK